VTQAIEAYQEDNDWLDHFVIERCDVGDSLREKSGDLYTAYRGYCANTGEYTRSTSDFFAVLREYVVPLEDCRKGGKMNNRQSYTAKNEARRNSIC